MRKQDATHQVVYYTNTRFEELIVVNASGVVIDAGPLLRTYKGRTLEELRQRRMVTNVEVLERDHAPASTPTITLTDMV